ncbi:MAG: hypothetical protein WHV64_03925 [Geminicoccaceae bacterium]
MSPRPRTIRNTTKSDRSVAPASADRTRIASFIQLVLPYGLTGAVSEDRSTAPSPVGRRRAIGRVSPRPNFLVERLRVYYLQRHGRAGPLRVGDTRLDLAGARTEPDSRRSWTP